MKKKVAIIYPFFAHYRQPIIDELIEDSEFEFSFIAGNKPNKAFRSLKLYDFLKYPTRWKIVENRWFFNVFLIQCGLLRILRSEKFDAVIFLGDWKYLSTWWANFYLRYRGTPTFFWSHGLLNNAKNINNTLKKLFLETFSNGGFLYSKKSRDIMLERRFSKPLHVIYNSLDYHKQKKIFERTEKIDLILPSQLQKPYVIFSARLIPERKLELLFKALVKLKRNGNSLGLLIIGDGPHRQFLESYSKELELEKEIFFFGSCYDEEVIASYYLNSIGCVFPGPIGLTIIHSFTYGVPVVTNDDYDSQKPEIEALIEGENGFTFENDNVDSLTEKLLLLLSLGEETRNQFREKAISVIDTKFNPIYQKKVIKEVLNQVI